MAVVLEESIRGWMAAHQPLRQQLAEHGTERFFAALIPGELPTPTHLERAAAAAREAVFAGLTADAVLDDLPTPPVDVGAREALRSAWLSLDPAWGLPGPLPGQALSAPRLAVAAAVGSLLGMMLLGGLLSLALDLRALGMVLGAATGAAAAMYLVGRLATSKALRFALKGLMGVAFTADLLGASALGFGAIWGRLVGVSLLRRVLVYTSVIALLAFTRGSTQYDAAAYRQQIREVIGQAVDFSALLLCGLAAGRVEQPQAAALDTDLARAIQGLHRTDSAGLPTAAEAVLLEARRLGLDGLTAPPRFAQPDQATRPRLRWDPDLAQQYRAFGLIEDGDTVIVEDEPVIVNGTVLEKGRVRKQRS
ncbi:MAG TPA: hypothetical protein VES73_05265 [Lamprocystis sp. (in: g-proteobacteria)]|nr:hypothetical protein [Lamprocystis sp. (in: g-proteobacteria)]